MPPKNDNLPMQSDPELTQGGTITYANEVIAIISGIAANEIEGIAGMVTSGGFGDIIGKNRNITRGVKVEVGTEEVSVDLYITVEYGQPIQKVASEVQENVRKSIEAMTGLKVVRVDIHVQGVSFEKEKKEAQTNFESANVPSLPSASKKKAPKVKEINVTADPEAEAKEEIPATSADQDVEPVDENPADTMPAEPAADEPALKDETRDVQSEDTHIQPEFPAAKPAKKTRKS
jgi:uncharacterized alkaline shock family protein YloU